MARREGGDGAADPEDVPGDDGEQDEEQAVYVHEGLVCHASGANVERAARLHDAAATDAAAACLFGRGVCLALSGGERAEVLAQMVELLARSKQA